MDRTSNRMLRLVSITPAQDKASVASPGDAAWAVEIKGSRIGLFRWFALASPRNLVPGLHRTRQTDAGQTISTRIDFRCDLQHFQQLSA
jgi:hypothetical protein